MNLNLDTQPKDRILVKTDKELFAWLRSKYPQTKDEPFGLLKSTIKTG
ncbi:hypothetical protein [Paenibacillus agricola]|uniref:Uncharacterized protein n=1 Tax=Paenibacillus agricola TaxID=2716264 RepID=A0ABX0J965_9BACL|nr:hypothetical protein [Paenibacillus agricola]NHN32702.1 hypothetical protein [Paenibacillus agricola]